MRLCYENGVEVTSLPGACACVTALTLSGLSTRRFCFEAFLPTDKKEHQRVLAELQNETRTIVLYEAPHHLLRTLTELYEALGDRKASICRELTKKYETAFRTTLPQAVAYYTENEPKGECVIVIEGKSVQEIEAEDQARWQQWRRTAGFRSGMCTRRCWRRKRRRHKRKAEKWVSGVALVEC